MGRLSTKECTYLPTYLHQRLSLASSGGGPFWKVRTGSWSHSQTTGLLPNNWD